MDYSKIDNIELEGVDGSDYPDFSDAFIAYAEYDGEPMTEAQLNALNEDTNYVYECVIDRLF